MNLSSAYENKPATLVIDKPYHQGICPNGWHVPDSTEWKQLFDFVEGDVYSLLAMGIADWPNATNSTGFSLIPAGHTMFNFVGYDSRLSMITEQTPAKQYYWNVRSDDYSVGTDHNKGTGFTLRCIKDSDSSETPSEE